MYKVLICDDDKTMLEGLKKDVRSCFGERVSEVVLFDQKSKLEFYLEEKHDENTIVLMDIQLKDGNGIQLAEKILEKNPGMQIIFISGYDNYYLDVYNVEHVFFLKKPIRRSDLKKSLERAAFHLDDIMEKCLIIKNKKGVHRIPYNEILFFENDKRQIHVHAIKSKVTYYGGFHELLAKLDDRFIQCHKSYISNVSKVRKLGEKSFEYKNGEIVPISKTYYQKAKEAFFQFLEDEE